jgi:hypothetical protein
LVELPVIFLLMKPALFQEPQKIYNVFEQFKKSFRVNEYQQ